MKDFADLLEYRRIFPPVLSICFAFYFIFLKERFGVGSEFNTTLFLIAVVLTSFSVSFAWKFFEMERRAINLPFIRVFVDYALKFNGDAQYADMFIKEIHSKYKEDPNPTYCYILFILILIEDNDNNSDEKPHFFKLKTSCQIHTANYSYNEGSTLVTNLKQALSVDKASHRDYFLEVEISKINAGKKSEHQKQILEFVKHCPLDENGKIIYETDIKRFIRGLKDNFIIKKYTIEYNMVRFTLNEAVIRWYHRDYLGNSYNKLEKALSRLLKINPTLVFGTLIGLFILSVFISKWLFVICLIAIILPFYFQRVGDCLAKYILKCISKYKAKCISKYTSKHTAKHNTSNTPPAP